MGQLGCSAAAAATSVVLLHIRACLLSCFAACLACPSQLLHCRRQLPGAAPADGQRAGTCLAAGGGLRAEGGAAVAAAGRRCQLRSEQDASRRQQRCPKSPNCTCALVACNPPTAQHGPLLRLPRMHLRRAGPPGAGGRLVKSSRIRRLGRQAPCCPKLVRVSRNSSGGSCTAAADPRPCPAASASALLPDCRLLPKLTLCLPPSAAADSLGGLPPGLPLPRRHARRLPTPPVPAAARQPGADGEAAEHWQQGLHGSPDPSSAAMPGREWHHGAWLESSHMHDGVRHRHSTPRPLASRASTTPLPRRLSTAACSCSRLRAPQTSPAAWPPAARATAPA